MLVLTVLLALDNILVVAFSYNSFFFYLLIFLYLFCSILHNLPDKRLIVKQASDMPAVQKSRHRIDPDAIPSPVSFLCSCLFLFLMFYFMFDWYNPSSPSLGPHSPWKFVIVMVVSLAETFLFCFALLFKHKVAARNQIRCKKLGWKFLAALFTFT